jgi:ABC-type transporter Mla subunit MlaD
MRKNPTKTLVLTIIGLFIFSACVRQGDYKLNIIFDNTEGLTTEADVTANGLKIGKVEKIGLLRDKIFVTTTIDKNIKIPRNSIFIIESVDLLGTKTISVKLDSVETKYYKDSDTIFGQLQRKRFLNDSTQLQLDSATITKLKPLVDTFASAVRDFGKSLNDSKKK